MSKQMNTTTETITILYREAFDYNVVAYTIKVTGFRSKEECVRLRDGKPNGCTCKNGGIGKCDHQIEMARIENEYQSH